MHFVIIEHALNEDEQIILDHLIENSSLFNYPAEMRLLDIGKEEIIVSSDKFPQGRHYVYVKLQGENKLGGKVSHFYQLYLDDCSFVSSPTFTLYFYKGQMELWESSVNPITYKSETVDISNINIIVQCTTNRRIKNV